MNEDVIYETGPFVPDMHVDNEDLLPGYYEGVIASQPGLSAEDVEQRYAALSPADVVPSDAYMAPVDSLPVHEAMDAARATQLIREAAVVFDDLRLAHPTDWEGLTRLRQVVRLLIADLRDVDRSLEDDAALAWPTGRGTAQQEIEGVGVCKRHGGNQWSYTEDAEQAVVDAIANFAAFVETGWPSSKVLGAAREAARLALAVAPSGPYRIGGLEQVGIEKRKAEDGQRLVTEDGEVIAEQVQKRATVQLPPLDRGQ